MKLLAFMLLTAAAAAEPRPPTLHLVEPKKLTMDSVFEDMLSSAGFRIDDGKLAFVRHGQEVAKVVGRSRLTPLVDVSLGGASAVMRFRF